jgi:hypothetical protein
MFCKNCWRMRRLGICEFRRFGFEYSSQSHYEFITIRQMKPNSTKARLQIWKCAAKIRIFCDEM